MQEADAEPWMRPLQNQLPVVRHLTTAAGLWMPQYLRNSRRRLWERRPSTASSSSP